MTHIRATAKNVGDLFMSRSVFSFDNRSAEIIGSWAFTYKFEGVESTLQN